jgi:hypothetical protein
MPFSTYSELQSAITDWMDRADLSGNAADFITLAEARLNRELEAVETTTTLTGTISSRQIDISALSVIEPIGLFMRESSSDDDEDEIVYKAPGTFPYEYDNDEPAFYTILGDNIEFDCPLDQAYPFRFHYRGRFALSEAAPTNALLTDHPDVYLAASIMWGGAYIKDVNSIAGYKTLLDEFMFETKSHLAQKKRGVLSVDPALSAPKSYPANLDDYT